MEFTAEQIAGILHGEIQGNPKTVVNDLSKIEEGKEGTLSFLSNPKYEEYIYGTDSSICIVNKTFKPQKPLPKTLTLVKVEDAYSCFAKLLEIVCSAATCVHPRNSITPYASSMISRSIRSFVKRYK